MRPTATLSVPSVATGLLMATYLLVRPYGDTATGLDMARAFASPRWVVAHTCGALALAAFAWLALRLHDLRPDRTSHAARATGLLGATLVLPYYGAESVGLHAIGARAAMRDDPSLLELVGEVRNQPIAITTFAVGLLLLAVSAVCVALSLRARAGRRHAMLTWPLCGLMALLLPQFYLPAAGRAAFGIAYLGAAILFAVACTRQPRDVQRASLVAGHPC